MSDVMDLNDLVKAIDFKVLGKLYSIPPMNDVKMKKVMGVSKEITNLSEKKLDDEEEGKLLELQNQILSDCVMLKDENGAVTPIPKEKFSEWPMRLKNKVLELIFNQLGAGAPEGEKEKN